MRRLRRALRQGQAVPGRGRHRLRRGPHARPRARLLHAYRVRGRVPGRGRRRHRWWRPLRRPDGARGRQAHAGHRLCRRLRAHVPGAPDPRRKRGRRRARVRVRRVHRRRRARRRLPRHARASPGGRPHRGGLPGPLAQEPVQAGGQAQRAPVRRARLRRGRGRRGHASRHVHARAGAGAHGSDAFLGAREAFLPSWPITN